MRAAAFTLVELVLIMAVMVIMLALAAPMLSNSLRGRTLSSEATRFVALTEFARSEAISQGVPTVVWLDPRGGRYGAEPKPGFDSLSGPPREFNVEKDVRIEAIRAAIVNGRTQAASFSPDGALSVDSAESVRFTDRFGSTASVVRNQGGWGYDVGRSGK